MRFFNCFKYIPQIFSLDYRPHGFGFSPDIALFFQFL